MDPSAVISTGSFRLPRLFLHFFDIHFLDEKGAVAKSPKFQAEVRLAFRLAVAVSDKVYVPASSYYESNICRFILDELRDLFELGCVMITGSSPNLELFFGRTPAIIFYPPGSIQHQAYKIAQSEDEVPPYTPRTRSATLDIMKRLEQFSGF